MEKQKNNSPAGDVIAAEQSDPPDKALIDRRFAHCGLDDPLLRDIHALALALADEQTWKIHPPPPDAPLSVSELQATLGHLPRPDLTALLNDEQHLPPAPQILAELKAVTANEKAGVEAIAAVVLKDTGLSAFLLRLVNSAFYSFPSKIDTVSRSVGILGVKPLYSLALGYVFTEAMAAAPRNVLDLGALWRHSLAVGIAAQALWENVHGKADSERLFVAGLLHDLGKLVLAGTALDHARLFYGGSAGTVPAHELEDACLGFNHARLGGLLLKKWNMPASLCAAVQWHHNPHQAAQYQEPLVVHLADLLVTALGLGARPGAPAPAPCPLSDPARLIGPQGLATVTEALSARLEDMHAAFAT